MDQVYAEPVLKEFESRQGIKVKAVYDVEGAKTTGLVNRLLAEKDRPQADVFWNGEFAQTILLKDKGALAAYQQQRGPGYPGSGQGPRGLLDRIWRPGPGDPGQHPPAAPLPISSIAPGFPVSGLAGAPVGSGLPPLRHHRHPGGGPVRGLGPEKARDFFTRLKARGVKVVAAIPSSGIWWPRGSSRRALPIPTTPVGPCAGAPRWRSSIRTRSTGGLGTLIIPNTVALIAGRPHPEAGKKFIDYLLSPGVTEKLIVAGWFAMPPSPAAVPAPPAADRPQADAGRLERGLPLPSPRPSASCARFLWIESGLPVSAGWPALRSEAGDCFMVKPCQPADSV